MVLTPSYARLWRAIREARQKLGYDPDELFTITRFYDSPLMGSPHDLPGRALKIDRLTNTSPTTIQVDPKGRKLACNEFPDKRMKVRVIDGLVEIYTPFRPLPVNRRLLTDVLNSLI